MADEEPQETVIQPPIGLTPDAEAAADAVLAEIMGGSPDELDAAGESGEEPEAPDEQDTAEEADAPPEEPSAEGPDDALEAARATLKLGKVSDDLLSRMDRDTALALAATLKEKDGYATRVAEERAELKRRLEALETTPQAEPIGVPAAQVDLEAHKAKLAEQFGDEESAALLAAAQDLTKQATAPLQQQLAASSALLEEVLVDRVKGELGASDSRLSDPETFDRVQTAAKDLMAAGRHKDLAPLQRYSQLMKDAALLELGPVPVVENGSPAQETPDRRRSTPTKPTRAPVENNDPQTYEEKVDATIAAIQRGANDPAALKRRFG